MGAREKEEISMDATLVGALLVFVLSAGLMIFIKRRKK
ncbi:LPXTG cell wall anchor domain-containing protein [Bacillus thuringiensis]|nr:LPXTG cell wall anchor domain-containing protein [Bacillus thuringiensis]